MSERPIKVGDAVAITLLDQSGQEQELSGQVTQVQEYGPAFFVACPFCVGPEHIRLIVPVEDLEK